MAQSLQRVSLLSPRRRESPAQLSTNLLGVEFVNELIDAVEIDPRSYTEGVRPDLETGGFVRRPDIRSPRRRASLIVDLRPAPVRISLLRLSATSRSSVSVVLITDIVLSESREVKMLTQAPIP
jgi:hypothetical protein